MPIYEYECRKCGHRFEMIKRADAPRRRKCPECGGRVDRLVHAPAIQFKGDGFYLTDYSDKGKKMKEAARREESSGKPKSSDSKKSDAKKSDAKKKPKSD